MIFDSIGLPKTAGETDYMDSARLSGMLALFGHPGMSSAKLSLYIENGICFRYPFVDESNPASNNPANVTRDQILPLVAGFYKRGWIAKTAAVLKATEARVILGIARAQNTDADVIGSRKPWYNGADLMLPSDVGHLRICAGLGATLLQRLWLRAEIIIHNRFTPLREPNQLMCKCKVAGEAYVALFKRNSNWQEAVRLYWSGWRSEPELAEFFIANF